MKSLLLLLSCLFVGSVLALPHAAISGGGCVLLDTKIYCYGGAIDGRLDKKISTIMSLDVASSFSVINARSNWVEVKPASDIVSGPNAHFSMVAVPSRDSFIVYGGWSDQYKSPLPYQTMIFNVLTQLWSTIDSANQSQTAHSAMVAGNDDKIYLWGGVSDVDTGAANITYPADMRILDLKAAKWSFVPYLNGSTGRSEHSTALSSDGKTVYFFGGSISYEYVNASYGYRQDGAGMSNILTFDTTTSLWGSVNTSSTVIPTRRRYHTSERIPGTNTILLYGGADGHMMHVSDYCYTLDLDTLQWKHINLPDNGAGPLYMHSSAFTSSLQKAIH
ncbi:hypothetical protein BX666DRAFT_1375677 [Dichotomocladium elegans]|nr:hypothetical protein BX666DRAFT_1375677 [Dichotomocladium elegans]